MGLSLCHSRMSPLITVVIAARWTWRTIAAAAHGQHAGLVEVRREVHVRRTIPGTPAPRLFATGLPVCGWFRKVLLQLAGPFPVRF